MTVREQIQPCYRCGGEMIPAVTNFCYAEDGRVWLFENVPAMVCDQCGERSYAGPVVDQIQQVVFSDAAPARTIGAGVFDLAAAHTASVPNRPSRSG